MNSQIAKLTNEDISLLKGEKTSSLVLMIIILLILVIASIALFAFFYLNSESIFGVIVGAFLALIPLFPALLVFAGTSGRMLQLNDEIHKGVKNVSIHPIEKQYLDIRERVRNRGKLSQNIQMSYAFYLVLRGEKMKVTEDEYYKCKEGQLVEIHESPESKKLLSYKILDKFADKFN